MRGALAYGFLWYSMGWHSVAVRAVRTVGPNTVAVTLTRPALAEVTPGQFVKLRRTINDEDITRFYSLSAVTAETLEVTVTVDPDGDLSPWLAAASAGATVELDGPYGQAYYDGSDPILILAAGPGLGPAVGVAEHAHAKGAHVTVITPTVPLIHDQRLAALSQAGGAVRIVASDRLTAAVDGLLPTSGTVFVYGFAPFVETATAAIDAGGGDAAAATIENFG